MEYPKNESENKLFPTHRWVLQTVIFLALALYSIIPVIENNNPDLIITNSIRDFLIGLSITFLLLAGYSYYKMMDHEKKLYGFK